jgi:hypothetical protein
MSALQVGDTFPVELLAGDDDCDADTSNLGFPAFCVLNANHAGKHIAANMDMVVVAVWA